MNSIFLKKEELSTFERFKPDNYTTSEGIFYFYELGKERLLMKIMKNIYNYYSSQGLKTIQILMEYKSIFTEIVPELVLPESLVYIDLYLVGYLSKYIEGLNLKSYLTNPNINFKQKIDVLQRIGLIFERVKNLQSFPYHFHFGDFHEDNVIITMDDEIKIIDSNGVSLFEEGINSKYLKLCSSNLPYFGYENKYNREPYGEYLASRDTDLLCYMMIVMNYLTQSNFSKLPFYKLNHYLEYLKSIGFSQDFLSCIGKLYKPENNENPYLYLGNITEDMLENAKMSVYIKKYN